MANILVTTSSFGKETPAPLECLKDASYSVILNPFGRKLTEREVADLLIKYDPIGMVAGVEPLTGAVMEKAKSLKVISRCGIGMDSVDLAAAQKLGVIVTNTPDAPTVPVAELTLGLILSLLRKIPASDAAIRKQEWARPMGRLLHGKTIGIIGCGRIGTCVAKLLSAFGCQILGYDPMIERSTFLKMVSLETLLAESDIVSLHLPHNEQTHHLLDAGRLRTMKPGGVLVNAARGGLIDEEVLFECLQDGHLAGAAFDCFEQEPYIGPLTQLENVVLTGHIGSYAKEGRAIMEQQAADNLLKELERLGAVVERGGQ